MPVDIASGSVELAFEDVALPGKVTLVWDRRYSTSRVGRAAQPFGSGWANRYFATLTRRPGGFDFVTPRGGSVSIDDPDGLADRGRPAANLGAFLEVFWDGRHYVVQNWDADSGEVWRYRFDPAPSGEASRLRRIEDVTGQPLELLWDERGRLTAVEQRAERRTLVLTYTPYGLVDRVIVRMVSGEQHLLARYEYDAAQRLAAAYDAAENADRYEYDPDGRLVREIVKDGGVFSYRYDSGGRCIRTSGLDHYDEKRLRFLDAGGITEVTDSYGSTRLYRRLPSGQLLSEADPLGGERTTGYDDQGRIVEQTDATGAVTRYAYDAYGNRTLIVDALGNSFRFEFNEHHLPVSMTDPLEQVWRREYDGRNRLTATIDPLGNRSEIVYDAEGNLAEVTDPRGARKRQFYSQGRLTAVTDWAGNVTRTSVDVFGRVTEIVGPLGEVTRLRYDRLGNNTEMVLPDGSVQRATYDAASNLTSFTDGEGHTTRFRFGTCRRLLEEVDPTGGLVRLVWGTEPGRLVQVVNEKGETHSLTYDAAGRAVEEKRFDGGTRYFQYDAEGYSVAYTNANEERISIRRDALHRVVAADVPGAGPVSFGYDPVGRLVAAGNGPVQVTFERDPLGRILREQQGEHWVESRYDAGGNIVRTATSLGHVVEYEYDPNGATSRLTTPGQSFGFERDPYSNEIRRLMPGAALLEQQYDLLGRLTDQHVLAGIRSPGLSPLSRSEGVGRRYAYDRRSAVVSIDDDRRGRADFDYDPAERLLRSLREKGPDEAFSYDATGNLARIRIEEETVVDDALVYGPGDLLVQKGTTRYEYDAEGRRISKIEAAGDPEPRIWRYQWDALDNLRRVTRPDGGVWTYSYDALARRVEKAGPDGRTRFVWDREVVLHETYDAGGQTAWIYDQDSFAPLATVQQGRVYPIITDHLGTPREILDGTGTVAFSLDTLSWGADLGGGTRDGRPPRCPVRFPGQWHDDESGLRYNRFRYYDPEVGSFVSRDPVRLRADTNFYSYVPNPIGWIDPWGLVAAPASLPNTPGVYVITNGNTSYVGSAGLGQMGMNDRVSTSSHTSAQALLSQPGTTVQFVQVDLGSATSRSDRNNILRFYEQREYDRQINRGMTMLNSSSAPPQASSKRAAAEALIKSKGASASSRRSTCR